MSFGLRCWALSHQTRMMTIDDERVAAGALPLGHVLLIRREGEDRVLRMVRYTATCPVCEGEITIEKGRRRLRGRLIGECGRNPVEHVFSFDFITRKGERL